MKADFDEYSDLDWFATDRTGAIAHFATGGKGAVPLELLSDRAHVQKTLAIARALPQVCEALINPDLSKYVAFGDPTAEARYLRSFVAMAERGLFSFDCYLDSEAPTPYFLVAKPEVPVSLGSLGVSDTQLLGLIRLHLSFSVLTHIDVAEVPGEVQHRPV
jgi:hypothetical protein